MPVSTLHEPREMHHHLAGKSTAGLLTKLLIRRRRLQANAVSLSSASGSMRQNEPLPGSSGERGTLMK